ncbi:hypothetical protein DFQ30_005023 [Apophysomyces sp. BC1015]|nr:hypothetical protein DFQ30_005023 [Apophysomyces sp. BC1015]
MSRAFAMLDEPLLNAARRSSVAFRYPATDMKETPTSYELRAEVPGVSKDDIEIELADNNTLILRGSIEHSSISPEESTSSATAAEQPAEPSSSNADADNRAVVQSDKEATQAPHWWSNERMTGSFRRTFTFPTRVDPESIKASCQDGILSISVPKVEKTTTRIPIN